MLDMIPTKSIHVFVLALIFRASVGVLTDEAIQEYSKLLLSVVKITGSRCLLVNLLPKTDLDLKNIFVPFIGNESQLYTQIFDVDLNGTASEIDKLGDEMRKGSKCNVVLGQVRDDASSGEQMEILEKIFSVAKKIRAGYICLIESKFKDNLEEMKKIGGKKIVAKAYGPLLKVDLVCPQAVGHLPIQSTIFGSKYFKANLSEMIHSFRNCTHPLKGKTLKAGSLGETPYVFSDHNRVIQLDTVTGQPLGMNNGFLGTIAKVLGFNYTTWVTGEMNFYDRNQGLWRGIVGEVIYGRMDIGITAQGYVPEIFRVIDYSNYAYIYLITIACCQPRRLTGFNNITRPFGIELWTAVVVAVIIVGLTFGVVFKTLSRLNHPMVYKSKNKRFYELIFDSMDSLIQYADVNGFRKKASFSSANILIMSWSLTGMLFVFAYTCNLRSSLIYKPTTRPPNTMEEVVDTGMKLYIPDRSTLMQEMAHSNRGVLRELLQLVLRTKGNYPYDSGAPRKIWEDVGNCEANMIHMKMATFYTTFPGYHDRYGRRIYNKSRIIREDFPPSYSGLLLPKYSEYTIDFNNVISRILAGGLLEHFTRSPLPLEFTMDPQIFIFNDDSNEKISMENLLLIFLIWFIGILLAAVVFGFEKYLASKRK